MEIALDPSIPTYSGGLGVLSGDMLRSAADLGVPIAGVTLVHRRGYFRQHLDEAGTQSEEPDSWKPERLLESTGSIVEVVIEGRPVQVRVWRYPIRGITGHTVPVYLLDTDLPENSSWDRHITDSLYGGDNHYRLCQEVVLGMGGLLALRSLGHTGIATYHMNEGHSALLALALLEDELQNKGAAVAAESDMEAVRRKCVFTTHTPVPAGHDQFPQDLVRKVLGNAQADLLESSACWHEGVLNMTYLALHCSRYVNGVAMRHGEVSRDMFPRYPIHAITNGVHAVTWTSAPFQELFDRHIPEWRRDNLYLRYAIGIPLEEVRAAHFRAKHALIEAVRQRTGIALNEAVMTIGFARRAAVYKRPDLLFSDPDRIKWLVNRVGPFQVIYAGKAHPQDDTGKKLIHHLFQQAAPLDGLVRFVYLENYDAAWAKLLCSGADIWLNTPQLPQEASGTSGMKAALNGVPSLSVLDGWWIEGHVEGVTGWSIGHGGDLSEDRAREAASLYDKLELVVLPMFYERPLALSEVRRSAIALNGAFFNTQRMIAQYVSNAYFPAVAAAETVPVAAYPQPNGKSPGLGMLTLEPAT